ncbi:hypothetical protein AB0G76_31850 [Streptomyces asoensis]|uniref:hypothetical protein n=1 Tax=Streptomyces asoensis TaxID=249586 RepID=UPI0033F5DA47
MTAPNDRAPASAENDGPTRALAPVGDRAPADKPAPAGEHGTADAEYSATVLASHWIQRPEPQATLVGPPTTRNLPDPAPDRVEGTVLRFGPGVSAAVAQRTHRTLPAVPRPAAPSRVRRHALPVLVIVLVVAFLAWQRLGPPVAVRSVDVAARPTAVGCDGTADIVGVVTTDGRPGTLSYRWTRSDGTASGVLREVVVRGQRQARLHLLWTFQGKGHYAARAQLHLVSPLDRTTTGHLAYDCP